MGPHGTHSIWSSLWLGLHWQALLGVPCSPRIKMTFPSPCCSCVWPCDSGQVSEIQQMHYVAAHWETSSKDSWWPSVNYSVAQHMSCWLDCGRRLAGSKHLRSWGDLRITRKELGSVRMSQQRHPPEVACPPQNFTWLREKFPCGLNHRYLGSQGTMDSETMA